MSEISDQLVQPGVFLVSALSLSAMIGTALAGWQRSRSPHECSIGTWIGFLSGAIPAIIVIVAGVGILEVVRRPKTLAGMALIPAMIGLLVGGVLDRLFERVLFRRAKKQGEGANELRPQDRP